MSMILERNGDSRWYLKHTGVAEESDIASALIKLTTDLAEDKDEGNGDEDLAAHSRQEHS